MEFRAVTFCLVLLAITSVKSSDEIPDGSVAEWLEVMHGGEDTIDPQSLSRLLKRTAVDPSIRLLKRSRNDQGTLNEYLLNHPNSMARRSDMLRLVRDNKRSQEMVRLLRSNMVRLMKKNRYMDLRTL